MRAVERFGGRAEPEIGLWIRRLRTDALEHLLRSHVDPLHIDRRVRCLELFLEVLEQVLSVRRVDGEHGATVRPARSRQHRQESQEEFANRHRREAPLSRFTKMRAPPGTPAGSCRNRASGTYT